MLPAVCCCHNDTKITESAVYPFCGKYLVRDISLIYIVGMALTFRLSFPHMGSELELSAFQSHSLARRLPPGLAIQLILVLSLAAVYSGRHFRLLFALEEFPSLSQFILP